SHTAVRTPLQSAAPAGAESGAAAGPEGRGAASPSGRTGRGSASGAEGLPPDWDGWACAVAVWDRGT
ncbi:hypothetical protein NE659_28020, partial [Flavonifractor plautii]|uniref:hypothetical protein n=1 Tax=Flavonifractor plautii TaxID=292800 RepID=UPI00210EEAB6